MILVELLLFIIPMLMGIALVAAAKLLNEKIAVVLTGGILGLTLFTTICYLITVAIPLTPALPAALLVVASIVTIGLLTRTDAWVYWRGLSLDKTGAIFLAVIILFTALLVPKLLFFADGSLSTNVLNVWGDVAWHMANITNFVEGQTVPPENPILAGTRLTYPFLVNFLSALILSLGGSYVSSVVLPAFILIPLLLMLLYCVAREATTYKSAGIIAVILFVGAGGTLGWLRLSSDFAAATTTSLTDFLLHLPRDYTGAGSDATGYHFLNPLLSLLLPQRSFLFGIPLSLAIILLLATARRGQVYAYLVAGVLSGLLPLFHGHTVLALLPAIAAILVVDVVWRWQSSRHVTAMARLTSPEFWRDWGTYVLMALIIGIPEVLYYVSGEATSGTAFFRFEPGWTATGNIAWFWFKNTGLIIPLTIAALFLPGTKLAKALALAGAVVFSVANMYLFAPWAWDNFKLLIFWFLFSLPLLGGLATYVWHTSTLLKVVTIMVIGFHIFTGSLDLVKTMLPTARAYGEWDSEAIEIANLINEHTPAGSSIVTAPYHNTPVALAGRRMYLGFPGHVWSHGGSHWERESAVKLYYEGKLTALPQVSPQYILVGPVERQNYPALVVRPEWNLVTSTASYQLYALPTR